MAVTLIEKFKFKFVFVFRLEWVIWIELMLKKGCVIVANKGYSQYYEWPLGGNHTTSLIAPNNPL